MRKLILASACLLALSACTQQQLDTTMAQPVPVAATTNAQTALATYQAGLGVAQVALINNPALLTTVNALAAKAAPYVAQVQSGTATAAAAPSLGAIAAQLLIIGAQFIRVVPGVL